jgi:hypothetical protein
MRINFTGKISKIFDRVCFHPKNISVGNVVTGKGSNIIRSNCEECRQDETFCGDSGRLFKTVTDYWR